jgi:signal transduction histidine kinase
MTKEDLMLSFILLVIFLGFGSFLSLALTLSRLIKLQSDHGHLLKLVRTYLRYGEITDSNLKQYKFSAPELSQLFRIINSLLDKQPKQNQDQVALEEVLSLGSRITEQSSDINHTAKEVCEILIAQCKPEIHSTAILLREDGISNIAYLSESAPKRLRDALLLFLDEMLDEQRWGYFDPVNQPFHNFSTFGIGLSLLVPLRDSNNQAGILWLGFNSNSKALSLERRSLVEAIAKHTAASFRIARAIEDRRLASEQQREYLLGISHDLRSPGNTALYAVKELIQSNNGNLASSQKARLNLIEDLLKEQMEMLTDFLDYAKYEKGFLDAYPRELYLQQELSLVLSRFEQEALDKGLEIIMLINENYLIHADQTHLRRIISNLLSNAIKYTDQGSITISHKDLGKYLEISISDSGIGIPEGEEENLFGQFRRMTNSKRRKGVGLGLAVTKALCEANRGMINYERNVPQGSTFKVTFMRSVATPTILPETSFKEKFAAILVLDDDDPTRRAHVRMFSNYSNQVFSAGTIEEAQEIFLAHPEIDLIVSDLILSHSTSLPLFDILSKTHNLPPLIIITGSYSHPALTTLREHYHAEILEKPIVYEELQMHLKSLLSLGTEKIQAVRVNQVE